MAGLWFTYFRLKEHRPSRFMVVLAGLVGGFLSAMLAVLGYGALDLLGYPLEWSMLEESLREGLLPALVIGALEEGCKLLPVLALMAAGQKLRRRGEAIVLACCAGIGFAAAENMILAVSGLSMLEQLPRAAAAPVTHALFAAPWGFGLGVWVSRGKPMAAVTGYVAAATVHGLYDLILASPTMPRIVAALLVFAIWLWVLYRTAAHTPADPGAEPSSLRRIHPAKAER